MWPDSDFHFIRPIWLVFVPYAIWLHLRLRRAYSAALQWQGAIAPALLSHLMVSGRGNGQLRPYQLMTALLVLLSVVVAGPTWARQITPFTEDHAPLIIAIELTPSMLCVDQQPTRLDRARQKVHDLLERRRGARTAVIGYAGTAHLLLPFTDDTELLEIYLQALHPDLMPIPGDEPERVLDLAETLFAREPVSGTLLFMTDGIDTSAGARFERFAANHDDTQLLFMGFGTDEGGPIRQEGADVFPPSDEAGIAPPLNRTGLREIASAVSGSVLTPTLDDRDIGSLLRRIRRHLVDAIESDVVLAWKDQGYPLVWAIAACMLVWFRRGWTVQWRL